MKKIIYFIFLFFIFVLNSKADFRDYENCFKNYYEIQNNKKLPIKVEINNPNEQKYYFFQNWKILKDKQIYNDENLKYFDYDIKTNLINKTNLDKINDWNSETYYNFDLEKNNFVTINFNEKISNFWYNLLFENDSIMNYYIWDDENNLKQINLKEITNYSFKYLKIELINNTETLLKWKIYEINFYKKSSNKYIISPISDKNIYVYNWFNCDLNKDFFKLYKKYYYTNAEINYTTDKNTTNFKINLKNNPKYNLDLDKKINSQENISHNEDQDKDFILDLYDNCPYDYNPNQLDTNWDWNWDLCSDKDKDWFFWKNDNCIWLSNPKQTDVNKNKIWDDCEKDKDNDWFFDSVDNCEYKYNPEQLDDDWDAIWNECDNCKFKYNPNQSDINNNNIWDTCDFDNWFSLKSINYYYLISIFLIIITIYFILLRINKYYKKV